MKNNEYKILIEKIKSVKKINEQYNRQARKEVNKALKNTDEKFVKTNEFREQQKDLIITKANKEDIIAINKRIDDNLEAGSERYSLATKTIHEKIDSVEKVARENMNLINNELSKRIAALEASRVEQRGKAEGYKGLIGWMVAIIAILAFLFKYFTFTPK